MTEEEQARAIVAAADEAHAVWKDLSDRLGADHPETNAAWARRRDAKAAIGRHYGRIGNRAFGPI